MKRDYEKTEINEKDEKFRIFSFISLFSFISYSLFISLSEIPLFMEKAGESGLNFRHSTGATGQFYMPEIMGAGAALFDYDNDGDLDIYLIQGAALAGKFRNPGNHLYRNEMHPSGKLRFTDVTARSGAGYSGYGMGAATGDYDNDGDLDLYLTNFGSNALFRNNGDATFTDMTREAGVDDPRWSTSAAFLDYDRDGDLDLFVCNYLDFTIKGNKRCFTPAGEPDYCSPSSYRPVPSRLYRNQGNGKFIDVTEASGIGSAFGPGLGVTCVDFNNDGLIDIYVANDGAANLLWINKGDGKFEENGLISGAAFGVDGVARAGMGVAAGDSDNDGDPDIMVTNLTKEGSTFYRNNSQGQFDDATIEYNLLQSSFLSTGFGVIWIDYDNDGWLDIFTANGAVTLLPALRGDSYPFHQRNQLFHNEGASGKINFREVSDIAGPALQLSEVSRAAAFGDLNNDGSIDIVVTNNNGPVRLLVNNNPKRNNWIQIKLIGVKDNRDGLGAKVAVFTKDRTFWNHIHTDGSYLCARDVRAHFGLGNRSQVEAIGVIWPSGAKEKWPRVKTNSLTELRQGTGKPWK
jgi:enediyne biosynthesis protein E4